MAADDERPAGPRRERAIGEVIARRLSRRAILSGLAVTVGAAAAPSLATRITRAAGAPSSLTFGELAHGYDHTIHVAPGYRTQVVIRWGDRVAGDAPPFDVHRQTAEAQLGQFGYNCDFVAYMPLPAESDNGARGLLCVNHEYTNAHLMFPGQSQRRIEAEGLSRAQTEVEIAAHGHSVVEIREQSGRWRVAEASPYNRRLSPLRTEMLVSGPAAGHERLKTSGDPSGRRVQGTLNNCSGGITPWGTVLIAEENFHQYFRGDAATTVEARNHARYGIKGRPRYPWWGRYHPRFDVAAEPREPNRFGWIVEFDPYDPASVPVKRTALGRFKHEAATTALCPDGRVAVYSGDDERFEYVYKFVSSRRYNAQDPAARNRLLDDGTLFVAKFNDDGSLNWLPLIFGAGPLTPRNGFASQAEVLIETRRAADLVGATPMDRPEDVEANPKDGRVYVVLTNNHLRLPGRTDGANPRALNRDGHILELIPPPAQGAAADHAASEFRWEIFLLAGDPQAFWNGARYHSAVSRNGWFSAPDNLAFDHRGRLWIATDGSHRRGFADGVYGSDTTGPARALTKHLFRAPVGAEVCGPAFTPDDRTLFVAIQHPGAGSPGFDRPTTRWPDFDPRLPPRPSVVAITRKDGREIGA